MNLQISKVFGLVNFVALSMQQAIRTLKDLAEFINQLTVVFFIAFLLVVFIYHVILFFKVPEVKRKGPLNVIFKSIWYAAVCAILLKLVVFILRVLDYVSEHILKGTNESIETPQKG